MDPLEQVVKQEVEEAQEAQEMLAILDVHLQRFALLFRLEREAMLVVQERQARQERQERLAMEAMERQADKPLEMVAPAEAGVVVAAAGSTTIIRATIRSYFWTPVQRHFLCIGRHRVAAVQALQIQGKMAFQELLGPDQALLALVFKITLIKCLVGIMMHFP
jgi:hypothetical protein